MGTVVVGVVVAGSGASFRMSCAVHACRLTPLHILVLFLLQTRQMDHLTDLFYNDFQGVATPKELADASRAKGIPLTQKQAKEFLSKQAAVQQFSKVDKKKLFIPITAPPGHYQVDLMFLKQAPVLVVIEITSRKVYTAVLSDKSGAATSAAMGHVINSIKTNGNQGS